MIYLASPYSHPDIDVMHARYEDACLAAGKLMLQGEVVFAPIAHSHRIGQLLNRSVDHDFWLKQDFGMLRACDECVVLMLPGWDKSVGVQREIEYCADSGIPVRYLHPEELGIAT